jgi:hypothetical protein
MLPGWVDVVLFVVAPVALTPPVGGLIARVYANERVFLRPAPGPLERLLHRVTVSGGQEWKPTRAACFSSPSTVGWRSIWSCALRRCRGTRSGSHSGTWDVNLQHRLVVCYEHELAVLPAARRR